MTAGTYPAGCRFICRYRDRIVLAGDPVNPHLWYMSRQGNAQDFDYGAAATDVQRAVAGQNSDAGTVGDSITALIPHSDDFLIVGGESSLWVIRGDPAYGGQIDALSRTVGVVGPDAWATAPDGSTWFVAPDGVYAVPPGAQGFPQAVSQGRLPQEFKQFGDREIRCVWDTVADGLRIFIGKEQGGPHWLVKGGTFWPLSLPEAARPFSVLAQASSSRFDGPVLMGGQDGAVRRFADKAVTDDGTAFTASVDIGPIRLTPTERNGGAVQEAMVVLASTGGGATAAILVGDTAEEARLFVSWPVNAADTRTYRPRAAGHSARLRISGAAPWAFESAVLGVMPRGKRRP